MKFTRTVFPLLVALSLTASAQILRLPVLVTVQAPAEQKTEPKPDHHLTPEEAKDLTESKDAILQFGHEDTGLPLKQTVKLEFVSRDQVQTFIEKRMKDDEDAQRLQRAEIVLKKFGLLPRDFNLQKFLVDLLREQVAGYYDPDSKTMNILDWLEPEQQKPVLAHELTHALQDQSFGLKKWMKEPKQNGSAQAEVTGDEETAARTAVVEGQAMTVMIDYLLEPAGESVLKSPRIVDAIEAGMATGGGTPIYNSAPLYLKDLLIFPYTYGLNFTRSLLVKGGKKQAFEQPFKKAPQNTRQIIQPETYLGGEAVGEMKVPELTKSLGDDYERYDVGSIGQFDSEVIVRSFSKKGENDKLSQAWRGGWYYAVKKKNEEITKDTLGLVYVSRWSDEASARQFAQLYASYVPTRYPDARRLATFDKPGLESFYTIAGMVEIRQVGNTVMAIESFDQPTTDKMRDVLNKSISAK